MRSSFAVLLLLFFVDWDVFFKYEYPKYIEGNCKEIIVTQAGIEVVETVYGDPAIPSATFNVQFYHPKGFHPIPCTKTLMLQSASN